MYEMKKPNLPIGYWLKRVDSLITEQVNSIQSINGITRTDWQVLHTLYEVGAVDKEQLFAVMHTFVDSSQLAQILKDLHGRGWVMVSQNGAVMYQLSDAGRQQHNQILAAQQDIRQQAMRGISQEEYATVMRVLQQMAANLETAVSERTNHGK